MPSLLIVGGLTVDRFASGRMAPGGSVIHAGLAAIREGAALSVVTVAGPEPEAREGIERLQTLGQVLVQPSAATTTYRHEEVSDHRVLFYEAASEPIDAGRLGEWPAADVALLAPIADELSTSTIAPLRTATGARLTVLLIQGWLRRLALGKPVTPMHLDEVPAATWRALSRADVIVVSNEDFAADAEDPFFQAAVLRERIGSRPMLVLTMATDGYLLDDPAADRVVASVPRDVVHGVATVGAGDTFGAALAVHLAAGEPPPGAADAATEAVIAMLERRRADAPG